MLIPFNPNELEAITTVRVAVTASAHTVTVSVVSVLVNLLQLESHYNKGKAST